jgi:uncharacterized membrane protein
VGAFFQSLGNALAAGTFLVLAVMALAGHFAGLAHHAWWAFLFRWLHVLSGVMWLGLLFYFNFVQIPSMARIPDEQKPAVAKVIAPAALFWFRHSALATVATGLLVAGMNGYLYGALTLAPGGRAIGIGMWLALVMAANVWFVIWPAQKVALGLVAAEAPARAAAARRAMLVSRFNTMLSLPMLYCMVAQQNAPF